MYQKRHDKNTGVLFVCFSSSAYGFLICSVNNAELQFHRPLPFLNIQCAKSVLRSCATCLANACAFPGGSSSEKSFRENLRDTQELLVVGCLTEAGGRTTLSYCCHLFLFSVYCAVLHWLLL